MARLSGWLALMLAAGAGSAHASLTWQTTRIESEAPSAQKAVTVSFPFKNTGDKAVRITSVEANCGCMAPKVPTEAIQPGEAGELALSMSFDGRVGRLHGTLRVVTDLVPEKAQLLMLDVKVAAPLTIQPRRLAWDRNEKSAPKFISITVLDPAKTTVEVADLGSAPFEAKLAPQPQAGEYRLQIHPKDTSRPANAFVKVRTITDGKDEEQLVFAAVK